jgi:hypothetical protein
MVKKGVVESQTGIKGEIFKICAVLNIGGVPSDMIFDIPFASLRGTGDDFKNSPSFLRGVEVWAARGEVIPVRGPGIPAEVIETVVSEF